MEDEFDLVYVAYITLKDGRRIYIVPPKVKTNFFQG